MNTTLTRRIAIIRNSPQRKQTGSVIVASGGTSDIPVCEEAALTAEFLGSKVTRLYDVGVAGFTAVVESAGNCGRKSLIAVAGMEGALPSVIGGLADCPVIAVPTSVVTARPSAAFRSADDAEFLRQRHFRSEHRQRFRSRVPCKHDHKIREPTHDILYLECAMGASGDMLLSASRPSARQREVSSKNKQPSVNGIYIGIAPCTRRGIAGLHAKVSYGGHVEGEEHHTDMLMNIRIRMSMSIRMNIIIRISTNMITATNMP
jgi:hypothetical protein